MITKYRFIYFLGLLLLWGCAVHTEEEKEPVDFVNPYMGNISHLLVPTVPTVHLPNSMLRVYPERADFTGDMLNGLPVVITSHRGSSAFNISPLQRENDKPVVSYSYDNEVIKPYYYKVRLDDEQINVEYAPSHQSALYRFTFEDCNKSSNLFVNSRNGMIRIHKKGVSGYQNLENNTRVYMYMEFDIPFENAGIFKDGKIDCLESEMMGNNACAVFSFPIGTKTVNVRYGISFISLEQAGKNLKREIQDYDLPCLAQAGRKVWNEALGKIEVIAHDDEKNIFYTLSSTYKCNFLGADNKQ